MCVDPRVIWEVMVESLPFPAVSTYAHLENQDEICL